MPRGYHPCFRSQSWFDGDQAILTFDSDGNSYRYTAVPLPVFLLFGDGTLSGEPWNAWVRGAIGPYIRL